MQYPRNGWRDIMEYHSTLNAHNDISVILVDRFLESELNVFIQYKHMQVQINKNASDVSNYRRTLLAHIKCTFCEKSIRDNTSRFKDVNKAQVIMDAFTWHVLIFTILLFAEHEIITPVCADPSLVTTNARPAVYNHCLFSECERGPLLVIYVLAISVGFQRSQLIPHFKCYHWMEIGRPNRVTQPHSTPHESAPKEEKINYISSS